MYVKLIPAELGNFGAEAICDPPLYITTTFEPMMQFKVTSDLRCLKKSNYVKKSEKEIYPFRCVSIQKQAPAELKEDASLSSKIKGVFSVFKVTLF